MRKFLFPLLIVLSACCCDDDDRCDDDNGNGKRECRAEENPTSPTPVPVPKLYTVEYRVIGTARQANIIYSNSVHGTTELDSGLPWVASFRTDKDRIFVSLYARAENPGIVRVQIFINNEIFREASSDGFFGSSAEVSGNIINPAIFPLKKQR